MRRCLARRAFLQRGSRRRATLTAALPSATMVTTAAAAAAAAAAAEAISHVPVLAAVMAAVMVAVAVAVAVVEMVLATTWMCVHPDQQCAIDVPPRTEAAAEAARAMVEAARSREMEADGMRSVGAWR